MIDFRTGSTKRDDEEWGPKKIQYSICYLKTEIHVNTWISYSSATLRQLSIAAGVVPQSSWSFSPIAPAAIISGSPSGLELFP